MDMGTAEGLLANRNKKNARRQSNYLHRDEAAFARWLAGFSRAPAMSEQVEKAQELLQVTLTERHLSNIKRTRPFRNYFATLTQMTATEAKEIARDAFHSKAPYAVDSHFEALENLKKLGDWKEVAKYTIPVLDRVVPKQPDVALQATQVTINLGAEQRKALDGGEIVVEAEEIPSDDSNSDSPSSS